MRSSQCVRGGNIYRNFMDYWRIIVVVYVLLFRIWSFLLEFSLVYYIFWWTERLGGLFALLLWCEGCFWFVARRVLFNEQSISLVFWSKACHSYSGSVSERAVSINGVTPRPRELIGCCGYDPSTDQRAEVWRSAVHQVFSA